MKIKMKTFLAVAILAIFFQGIASAASSAAIKLVPASEESAAAGKSDVVVHQVELYVTSWCPYCKQAEIFFRVQGIPFIAYDIEKDSAAARRKEQLDSSRGVPFAIINGQMIHGYSESAYREALQKRP
jgi:glutaredoxin